MQFWQAIPQPAVAEAAAIGIPDPLKGETIKVFVQTRSDHLKAKKTPHRVDQRRGERFLTLRPASPRFLLARHAGQSPARG